MKKLLLMAMISTVLAGCSTADFMKIDGARYFQIFQVLDSGGFLARRCTKSTSDGRCYGPVVYMPKSVDDMPYDEKVLHLGNPKIIDTYTYTTRKNELKTIPVIVDAPRQ